VIRVESLSALRLAISAARRSGRRVGLVPTMGFLHEGHLSLVDIARAHADFVVMSVYVNPLQFGPGEDLERYPRDLERDAVLAAERGVDALYTPADAQMYPTGPPSLTIDAPALTARLCGAFRPGHFQGVLVVVAKLINQVQPDVAVFGRKDYQQLALIRRMARDLDMGVEIVGGPIVREADGLALSSRNVYLEPKQRKDAPLLNRALEEADAALSAGETDPAALVKLVRKRLGKSDRIRTQYVELVDPETLAPVERAAPGHVLALAVHLGSTRLIDNRVLGGAEPGRLP
jgi:pantoate--beta-alanine ligase